MLMMHALMETAVSRSANFCVLLTPSVAVVAFAQAEAAGLALVAVFAGLVAHWVTRED